MRARYASTSATELTLPFSIADWSSAILVSYTISVRAGVVVRCAGATEPAASAAAVQTIDTVDDGIRRIGVKRVREGGVRAPLLCAAWWSNAMRGWRPSAHRGQTAWQALHLL